MFRRIVGTLDEAISARTATPVDIKRTIYYVSNFYNGISPNDRGANGVPLNPAFKQPFIPAYADTNAFVLPNPFNAYLQFNMSL